MYQALLYVRYDYTYIHSNQNFKESFKMEIENKYVKANYPNDVIFMLMWCLKDHIIFK